MTPDVPETSNTANTADGAIEIPDATPPAPQADLADARRCGFVAIIGAPNAGKSTLVNALVGVKIAIVTHKVQTTRVPVRGITVVGDSQIVFIDTPGIFQPRRHLDRAMVNAAWSGATDGDLCVLIVDAARRIDPNTERILTGLADIKLPKWLVLNKVDKVTDKAKLLALTSRLTAEHSFDEVFMVSAATGDGLAGFKQALADAVPPGPWHFAADDVSDLPNRMLAAEITREKVYLRLHDELPYAIAVETTDWKDFKNGDVRIEQTIYVERDTQKKIVLGKSGQTIKQISSDARTELMTLLERPVHLFVFVKVRENWSQDPDRYRDMGLNFPGKS